MISQICSKLRSRSMACSAALFLTHGALAAPSNLECEVNRVAAERAAQAAVSSHHELDQATNGLVVGGGCGVAFIIFGGADLGITGLICSAVTAAAVVATTTPSNAASIAGDAYLAVRNPQCVGK